MKDKKAEKLEELSAIFKALGHPVRLKIIGLLLKDACNVNKIVEDMDIPQSTVSQHLATLKNSGILSSKRTGTKKCYGIVNKEALKILKLIEKSI